MDFQDRINRLRDIFSNVKIIEDYPLLKGFRLSEGQKTQLETATNFFLYDSLRRHVSGFADSLDQGFFERNVEQILALPNVTPNGLVLPKRDNYLSYNIVHKCVADIFRSWDIDTRVDRIHVPINIRVVSGRPSPAIDERPRATTKPHSDIWAAEPAHCIMIFFALFGDYARSGIDFFEPKRFPKELARPLDDFSLGERLMSDATQYPVDYPTGSVLITDPFLLHRTMKAGGRARLSIDFRFLPKKLVASDVYTDSPRLSNYISLESWYGYGLDRLLVSRDPLDSFHGRDTVINGYAAPFESIKV
jgi:hypothetical protein